MYPGLGHFTINENSRFEIHWVWINARQRNLGKLLQEQNIPLKAISSRTSGPRSTENGRKYQES